MLQEQTSDSDEVARNLTSTWTHNVARLHDSQSPSLTSWEPSKSGYESGSHVQDDMNGTMSLPQETAIPAPRRHRLNSYKNPKDNDGRQEFATLAVVFGREEYTEPKPLWERQEDSGHVDIKDRTVVLTSYIHNSPSEVQSISQIVNSSFPDVSDELTQRSTFGQSVRDPVSPMFSLPLIPQIASFPEYKADDSTLPYPKTDDSVCSLSPTTSDHFRRSLSPKHISYHSNRSSTYEEYDIAPPLLFLDYPPAIFDALVSDVDERIIVWGTDPNKPGPKNTTTPTSSAAPSITKGFSANATSPSVQPPPPTLRRKISQSLVNSALRISLRKKVEQPQSLLMQIANQRERPNSLLDERGSSYSNENSFSNEQRASIKREDAKVITAATVEKLVEKLTIVLDYGFLTDFFLTYRTFISPLQLCKLLILRFRWSFINDDEPRRVVRIRTFVVIRHWLLNYFVHDFIPSRQLRLTLTSYINQLAFHPLVRQSVRDQRIVKGLKRVIRRLKMVYYRQAESGNVRIISPPPLSPQQEQIEKLVRGKLMQNPVRRTATTSLSKFKWSGAKMNGNTAISDANLASVVVIGNIDRKGGSSANPHSDMGKKIFRKSTVRSISLTDVRSSVLGAPIRRSIVGHASEENMKFVSIKTLQMQRRAEIERQQSEVEREYERQRQIEGRPLSIASDDSLESELTAGTTDDELDHASEDEGSVIGKEKNFEEELRSRELELQRRRLEEEEEMKRVNFYAHGDIASEQKSENVIPQSLNIFKNPHSHTVSVERARDSPPLDRKSSALSVDAIMVSGRKHSKRPGLPADFWVAGVQATAALSQPKTNTAPATNTDSLDSPSQDSIQSNLISSMRGKNEQNTRAGILQGRQFPSGLAKGLSQKSIERRRSERDLRQLYLKSDQDTNAHENGFNMAPIPPVPNIDNTYAPSIYSSVRKSHLSSDSSDYAEGMEKMLRRTPSGRFVNMIAEELRRENPDNCGCVACQGIADDTSNCKRLSVLLDSSNPERRESIELRHRRGASVDRLSEVTRTSTTGYEGTNVQEGNQVVQNGVSENDHHHHHRASAVKAASTGLSSEAADTITSLPYVERNSVPVLQDIDLLRQVTQGEENGLGDMRCSQVDRTPLRGLERMPSVVSALRTVQLKEQPSDVSSEVAELAVATSSAGFQDAISEPSSTQSPLAQDELRQFHLEVIDTEDRAEVNDACSTPLPSPPSPLMESQPILGHVPKTKIEARSYFRRSFILYERSESIAQQLCLVERDVLLAVQWEELVHCRWTKMNINMDGRQDGKNEDAHFTEKPQKSSRFDSSLHHGVQDAIQRFNMVCQWVASEIVRAPNLEVRVRTIEKFIRIAEKCRMYSNFATLIQVLLGLQAPAVSRLHKTWSKVRNSELKILDELSSFTSPTKNWKHMRDSMTTVAEEYGMSSTDIQIEMPGTSTIRGFPLSSRGRVKIPFGGCIPFLGIYLSDLVFNSEQPAYIESPWEKTDTNRIYRLLTRSNNQKDISPLLKQPLVNFSKHRVTAMIIKRVLTFQNLARRYPFELNPDLYSRCNEFECLSPDVVKALSHVTERHKY